MIATNIVGKLKTEFKLEVLPLITQILEKGEILDPDLQHNQKITSTRLGDKNYLFTTATDIKNKQIEINPDDFSSSSYKIINLAAGLKVNFLKILLEPIGISFNNQNLMVYSYMYSPDNLFETITTQWIRHQLIDNPDSSSKGIPQ